MNRRRKLLIPLLFCGAMLTACDDKSAENAAAMTPEVGVVTLPRFGQCVERIAR